ncbi:MAG TPA: ABC transporter ATP-binding protein [Candidatus Dormibacteraeota bacterium]|nr:ABC transporter ATP-binding protein [Candidatus Dormibacteraeota bacterium]
MTPLRLAELQKTYGSTPAVRGVSLDVQGGEVLGLLGPSGCGKTTVLKCMAGLEQPTGGEIWIGDRLVASARESVPPERRNIGMVFQSYALWPHKTVFANIAYPLEVRGRPREEVRRRVGEALEVVGLTGLDARYPSQLSGRQQQRVAIARSIVYEPQVLLFDEPLSNLDANTRLRVRGDLKRLLKRLGITAVYVTHDQTEAMAICDRIALMHGGSLIQVGPPDELYARPKSLFVAELIGSGNILAGEVAAAGEIQAGGLRIACTAMPATAGSVDVVLRREALQLLREPIAGGNCWPAQVAQRVSFGFYQECAVSAGGTEITVHTADADWEAGQQGYLTIRPDDVIAFPREG